MYHLYTRYNLYINYVNINFLYIDTIYFNSDEMFPPNISRNTLRVYSWHIISLSKCKDKVYLNARESKS